MFKSSKKAVCRADKSAGNSGHARQKTIHPQDVLHVQLGLTCHLWTVNTTNWPPDGQLAALYDAMHQRMQTPKAKRIMRRRSSTVEPVLGTLINFLNMKRINARGMAAAHKHVLMAATCYNLKKYLKTLSQPGKVREKVQETGKKGLKKAFLLLFSVIFPFTASTARHVTTISNR